MTNRRLAVFASLIGVMTPGRLLDLGAGHGRFSIIAADQGWEVTAVDARSDRFPTDHRIKWQVSDVRDVDFEGYDLIACLGLFYHLTPDDQVSVLGRSFPAPLIIDTHLDHGIHEHSLSERETFGEYEGRWYAEPGELTSAWGNPRSFWPTLESFLKMLADSGYETVMAVEPWITGDRTFFFAVPPWLGSGGRDVSANAGTSR